MINWQENKFIIFVFSIIWRHQLKDVNGKLYTVIKVLDYRTAVIVNSLGQRMGAIFCLFPKYKN